MSRLQFGITDGSVMHNDELPIISLEKKFRW